MSKQLTALLASVLTLPVYAGVANIPSVSGSNLPDVISNINNNIVNGVNGWVATIDGNTSKVANLTSTVNTQATSITGLQKTVGTSPTTGLQGTVASLNTDIDGDGTSGNPGLKKTVGDNSTSITDLKNTVDGTDGKSGLQKTVSDNSSSIDQLINQQGGVSQHIIHVCNVDDLLQDSGASSQTIILAPGVYDMTSQTTNSFTLGAGSNLIALVPGTVTIKVSHDHPIYFNGGYENTNDVSKDIYGNEVSGINFEAHGASSIVFNTPVAFKKKSEDQFFKFNDVNIQLKYDNLDTDKPAVIEQTVGSQSVADEFSHVAVTTTNFTESAPGDPNNYYTFINNKFETDNASGNSDVTLTVNMMHSSITTNDQGNYKKSPFGSVLSTSVNDQNFFAHLHLYNSNVNLNGEQSILNFWGSSENSDKYDGVVMNSYVGSCGSLYIEKTDNDHTTYPPQAGVMWGAATGYNVSDNSHLSICHYYSDDNNS